VPPTAHDLEIDPSTPTALYAAVSRRVARFTDGGATWTLGGEVPASWVWEIDADPNVPGTVIAAGTYGLFRSTDAGAHWQGAAAPLSALWVTHLLRDAEEPNVLLAAAAANGPPGRVPDSGLFRSDDGGLSWRRITSRYLGRLTADPHSAGGVWAVDINGVLERSDDGGLTWRVVSRPPSFPRSVAAHPRRPGTLLAGSLDGLLRSDDAGLTWRFVDGDLTDDAVTLFAFEPETDRIWVRAPDGLAWRDVP
jgi:photosystem II stability/assembly factor-like uncharacterized protein